MNEKRHDATPRAWSGDVALRGPDAPKNDGSLKHLIEYLLTVYERFGNTLVTESISLQWGATALHKRDEQKKRIEELEQALSARSERLEPITKRYGENDVAAVEAVVGPSQLVKIDDGQSVHVRTAAEWLDLARRDLSVRSAKAAPMPTDDDFEAALRQEYGGTKDTDALLEVVLPMLRADRSATAAPEVAWWHFAIGSGMIRDGADGVAWIKSHFNALDSKGAGT